MSNIFKENFQDEANYQPGKKIWKRMIPDNTEEAIIHHLSELEKIINQLLLSSKKSNTSNGVDDQNDVENTFINKKEAAKKLDVTERTLTTYMKEAGLPYYKVHRKVYFKPQEIDEFIAKHKISRNG